MVETDPDNLILQVVVQELLAYTADVLYYLWSTRLIVDQLYVLYSVQSTPYVCTV